MTTEERVYRLAETCSRIIDLLSETATRSYQQQIEIEELQRRVSNLRFYVAVITGILAAMSVLLFLVSLLK